jgi:hypothetical protein
MRPPLTIALWAILAACSPVDRQAPELSDINHISYNSLAPVALTDNGPALHELSLAALPGATTDLVDSEDGRNLLKYLVRCAMPEEEVVTFPLPGGGPGSDGGPPATDLELPGMLGFAPEWSIGPLDLGGQRLMTACLMAHINAFRIQVPISVRTASKGAVSQDEALQFPAQELTAYGNYFTELEADRELHVCFGNSVALALGFGGGVGGERPTYLDLRICSTEGACGFNRVGACFQWPELTDVVTSACETRDGDFYAGCHEESFDDETVPTTPAWTETVSVYLQVEDMEAMVEEYRELACAPTTVCDAGMCNTVACDVTDI